MSRRSRSQRRPRQRQVNFRRDLGLYLRVLRQLGRYKWIVTFTVLAMVIESALLVVSIGMMKPALDLIFQNELIRFDSYAEDYPVEIEYYASDPTIGSDATLYIGGYFFLQQHRDTVDAAILDVARMEPAGTRIRIRPRDFHEMNHELRGEFRAGFADNVIWTDDDPGDRQEFPVGQRRELPGVAHQTNGKIPKPGTIDDWKIEAVEKAERWLTGLQASLDGDTGLRVYLLWWLVAGLLVLTSLKVFAAFFSNYLANWLGFAVIRDIRQTLYAHMLELDFKFFTDRSLGDLISRITADLGALQTVVTMVFSRFLQSPIKVCALVIGMLMLSPTLTAVSLLGVVPVAVVIIYLINKVRRATRKLQKQRADLTNILQETFAGIRTVKAYGMEDYELGRFGKRNERLTREQNRAEMFGELSSQLNEVIFVLIIGGLLLLGGHYIFGGGGGITASDFITFIAMMGALWGPIRKWGKSLVKIQQGLTGAERVFEILDVQPAMAEKPDAIEYDGADTTIEFTDAGFRYREDVEVLRGVSLTIEPGTTVALVGRTGSGKSTLVNLVPRFYDVTGGAVSVGGHDVRDYKMKSLRERIAFVSQHVVLFDDSIRANIAYGRPDIPMEQVEAAARAANIHDEIVAMPDGYSTQVGGHGVKLSGGQRQRVAMARALLRNTPIIILDEATSALDVETEKLVQQALERLVDGRTVIVIAHRLSTIQHADRICFLKDGQLVEAGTHDELMELDGEYARYQRLNLGEEEAKVMAAAVTYAELAEVLEGGDPDEVESVNDPGDDDED